MNRIHRLFTMAVAVVLLVGTTGCSAMRQLGKAGEGLLIQSELYSPDGGSAVPSYFTLIDGRGQSWSCCDIGVTNLNRVLRFGVSARSAEPNHSTSIIPSHYEYQWQGGPAKRMNLNGFAEVRVPKHSKSGTAGLLTVSVFYKRVTLIRDPAFPTRTRQVASLINEPAQSKTFTVYFW